MTGQASGTTIRRMTEAHNLSPAAPFDPVVELGARISDLAWRKRVTHTAIGAALGIGQSTVSKKLRGTVAITIADLYVIAGLLGVEPGSLLARSEGFEPPTFWLVVDNGPVVPGQRPPTPDSVKSDLTLDSRPVRHLAVVA